MNDRFALVVEDTREIAQFLSMALQLAGYETEIILTGDAAMDRLETVVPDVVVLDLFLPNVRGPEILRYIRSEERLSKTRVIIVSADARGARELKDVADLVLVKPVGLDQIRDLAQRLKTLAPDEPVE